MRALLLLGALGVLLFRPALAAPDAPFDQELLLGVRAFRAEHYEEALQIFRRVEATAKVPEIGFYLGTTLHKLGRDAESLSAFRAARARGLDESLSDYYQSVSCYRLGMLERARQGFERLLTPAADGAPRVGPRLLQGTRRFLLSIEAASEKAPAAPRYAAVLERSATAPAAAALEWLDEAVLLSARVPEAERQLPRLRDLLGRLRGDRQLGREATALLQGLDAGRR